MNAKRAIIFHPRMPEFDRERGSQRTLEVIQFLQEAGWSVTFVAQNAAGGDRYVRFLQQRGVTTYAGFDEQVDQMIAVGQFDLAILAFWFIAETHLPIIRKLSPRTRVIVDMIDLHFLREARRVLRKRLDSGASNMLDTDYASRMMREVNTYAAADGVLAVSQKEADLINDLTGDPTLAYVVPLSEDLARSEVPFSARKGMVFVGNFRHLPNGEAVEYLCRDVLPRLDPNLLDQHPVYIIGNAFNDRIRGYGSHLPQVRMVGWVPSVLPYLQQTRVALVPLLHGAGVKGKLLQSLMIGTPSVSTSIGAEGLDLKDGQHLLVADDPEAFAASITRLLTEEALWQRLAAQGHEHVASVYGKESVRKHFMEAISTVLAQHNKPLLLAKTTQDQHRDRLNRQYPNLITRLRETVNDHLPAEAVVAVVSKGDDELLNLGGRAGWHFPQDERGVYSGYYPADSATAIQHLEALRSRGAEYLLFPSTALWWLDHYTELRQFLEQNYKLLVKEDNTCHIFSLRERTTPSASAGVSPGSAAQAEMSETSIIPTVGNEANSRQDVLGYGRSRAGNGNSLSLPQSSGQLDALRAARNGHTPRHRVLALGVYMADQKNNIDDIVSELSRAGHYSVIQRWVALGGQAPTTTVSDVTVRTVPDRTPKFQLINDLLAEEDVSQYDYVLVVDDDIALPRGFVEDFIGLQHDLGFSIAQPARTLNSYSSHPIVEQQLGVLARQTLFVEVGPVVSFHKDVFNQVFPFDLTSPMGWGYGYVWPKLLSQRGLKMGIVDATPVEHSLRPPVANYDWEQADRERTALLGRHDHLPREQCFTVLDVFNIRDGKLQSETMSLLTTHPLISVVIATYNRADLLEECLTSFIDQSIPQDDYEVIVVDDGSNDTTPELCESFMERLPLKYFRIDHAGRSSAKNLGIFASSSPLVVLFDDDDIADTHLLQEHLKTHEHHPEETVAVLGYTTWGPDLEVTPVMEYVTDIGHFLFAYRNMQNGQVLDFKYFWEGRISCKKSFLVNNAVHNQQLHYTIDIELSYRLSKLGLKVIYNRNAVSYMIRPVTYEQFCMRCEGKGKAQFRFSQFHPDQIIQDYCQVTNVEERWAEMSKSFEEKVQRVRQLEALLPTLSVPEEREQLLKELRSLYGWTFKAFQTKGIMEAKNAHEMQAAQSSGDPGERPLLSIVMPIWNVSDDLAEMTARNIERIWDVRQMDVEIIVVDNGSTHERPYSASAFIRWEENLGISSAWNAGAKIAKGNAICFINSDVWVYPGWDKALYEAALDGRRIVFPYTDHDDGRGPRQADTAGMAGWCFVLSKQTWDEIGTFDEAFNPAFFEDTDYFHRAWQDGVELNPVPAATVKHIRRTTAKHHSHMDWLFQAHRLKYGWKHGVEPTAPPPIYLREVVEYEPRRVR